MNQDEIFTKVREKKVAKQVETEIQSEKNIPIGFIPVKLSSKDKLGPAVLHFRNYSMNELLEITTTKDENQLSALIYKALNSMCYEKYDCAKLHLENIKEIMLTLHLNFWSNSLLHKPYYIDLEGDLQDEKNIAYTDIELSKLNIIDINDDFKNPFTIVDNVTGSKVKFILPTIEHVFIADKFIKEYFSAEEAKFRSIKSLSDSVTKLEKDGLDSSMVKVTPEELDWFEKVSDDKTRMYLKLLNALLLVSIDGKELTTTEEKLEAFSEKVDATTWLRYTEAVEKHATFGVDPNYKFMVDGKELIRRFSFRYVELLPSVDKKPDTGYTVSFDD